MKQIHILFFILTTLLSCNKNDEKLQIQDLLIGQWKLTAFVNENSGITIVENEFENTGPFILIFKDDFSISGDTYRNELSGTYALNNSKTAVFF